MFTMHVHQIVDQLTEILYFHVTETMECFKFFVGVQLYQGLEKRIIPDFAMIGGRDFFDVDVSGSNDGIIDGIWCQSSDSTGIGSWKLPDGNAVPNIDGVGPIYMESRSGQVALLRRDTIRISPYQGMYTCTIPDENGVNQTLVVWAGGIAAYDGTDSNREY